MSVAQLRMLLRPEADQVWKHALAAGTAVALTYLLTGNSTVASFAFTLCAIGPAIAAVTGPRRHGVDDLAPWNLVALATALFGAGAFIRPLVAGSADAVTVVPDLLCTLPGYLCFLLALTGMARRYLRGARAPYLGLDIAMALGGTASLVLAVFAIPASVYPGRRWWLSLVVGTYPLFDVACLAALTVMALTTAARLSAFRMLSAAFVLMLLSDLGYAYLSSGGAPHAPRILDAVFLLAFALFTAAALHPSVRGFNDVRVGTVQAWTTGRVAALAASASLPGVGMVAAPSPTGMTARLVLAAGASGVVLGLIWRAVGAVNSNAQTQAHLTRLAHSDALTGLGNRLHLEETISRQLADRRPPQDTVSVIAIDIDGFKYVNDSFGHAVGDELLGRVAQRLDQVCHAAGAVAARLGGDLFAVTVDDGRDGQTGSDLADDLVAAFAAPLRLSVGRFDATVSVGVANSADLPKPSPGELLRAADAAMYEAKSTGRGGCVRYDQDIQAEVAQRLEMEQALRGAVEEEQFGLEFQPCVRLGDGARTGLSARVRWEHPKLGVVPPQAFLSLAEEFGLAERIGEQVLAAAVSELARTDEPSVSVPVPGRQLTADLPGEVAGLLADRGVAPSRLVVEVTEKVAAAGGDAALALRRLRELGVRVAVTGFGTAGGSLDALRLVDVDQLKLDPSMVARLGRGRTGRVVRAAVAVADAVGAELVATGVETPAQQDALRELGVEVGQGWLYGTPVSRPVAEVLSESA